MWSDKFDAGMPCLTVLYIVYTHIIGRQTEKIRFFKFIVDQSVSCILPSLCRNSLSLLQVVKAKQMW